MTNSHKLLEFQSTIGNKKQKQINKKIETKLVISKGENEN